MSGDAKVCAACNGLGQDVDYERDPNGGALGGVGACKACRGTGRDYVCAGCGCLRSACDGYKESGAVACCPECKHAPVVDPTRAADILKRLVIAFDADHDLDFDNALIEARALFGFVLADDTNEDALGGEL